MSGGGGGKKRSNRAEGWEKADGEFYQERYPTTAEVDEVLRDPSHIATLLPSKQSRAATNKRVRPTDTKSLRRRTSTRARRESTFRRQSCVNDVQVSMLPDLSENMSNEQNLWEEIMQIKALPLPMAQKREQKSKLQASTHLRLQGYEQFKWQKRKVWQQFKTRLKEMISKLELWRHSLKKIEGNFGTGVVAFFLFLRWLMFLNLAIFILIFCFIILPTILNPNSDPRLNSVDFGIFDIIQGTGTIRDSIMFMGFYNNTMISIDSGSLLYYNLPLAYILVNLALYFLSLIAIVKSAARGFKERLVEGEGQFYQYCNLVFGGWDFCIHNEKSAKTKHKALFNEIKACLEAKRLDEKRRERTQSEKNKLIIIRTVINILVLSILGSSLGLIFFIIVKAPEITGDDIYTGFFKEYLPSICITGLNAVVPITFKYLITYENYSPGFVLRLTLLRTILLKLLSLAVLVTALAVNINIDDKKENSCWETYVGQQIYKLVITDFGLHVVLTFFVNFPRSLIGKHFNNKFAKLIGEQQYDLPKNVLDIIYSQTLCWLGMFFAPLLPAIATITGFLMFYIKKFVCLVNSVPSSSDVYRASRSNSMFMFVLLIAQSLAFIPVALSIAELEPSANCGPFRGISNSSWTYVVAEFDTIADPIKTVIFLIGTAWFTIPVFIFLVLCLYYYSAITDANRHMVDVLKNQLILEGHDKQFLLNRLIEFSKQQQEYQKRIRNTEMLREHDRVTASN